LFFIISLGS
jgi:hypothetical protein